MFCQESSTQSFVTVHSYSAANMIQAQAWNDETNMLAAMTDGKILIWYYPNAIYVDKDLLPKTLYEKDTR